MGFAIGTKTRSQPIQVHSLQRWPDPDIDRNFVSAFCRIVARHLLTLFLNTTDERGQAPVLNGKSLLITGGTGSFGKQFAQTILRQFPDIRRLVIFSRDELKQYEMSCSGDFSDSDKLRFFIGDIRDRDRLNRALEGIDVVIHAAALKQVPAAEYNPFEAIKTNVLGAQNLIETCLDKGVQKVVALSTDKAAAPVNLYGATKLCSDKLFTAANSIVGGRDLKISVVRYGNVMGSRGSVIPFFMNMKSTGILPITHPDMTRFNISLEEGVRWSFGHWRLWLVAKYLYPKSRATGSLT